MKKILLAMLAVSFPLAITAQTAHFKSNIEGAFASVALAPDPLTTINLSVSRGTTSGVSTTTIAFFEDVFASDFNSITITEILGNIPNSAFTGDTVQGLNLSLNTSTLDPTTTFSETCVLSLVDFSFTCSPITQGSITLSFRSNGFLKNQILTAATVQTFGPVTIRTHQRANTVSANVTGTVFTPSVSSSNATVGVNDQSQIEIIRN
jgi:hypothetical protein